MDRSSVFLQKWELNSYQQIPARTAGLAHGFGKQQVHLESDSLAKIKDLKVSHQVHPKGRYLDTPPQQVWLQGRDLAQWQKENPEAAKVFGLGKSK